MNLWTAIVIIVAVGTLGKVYQARLKANAGKPEEFYDGLTSRVDRMEDRIANLETIILEKERGRAYDNL